MHLIVLVGKSGGKRLLRRLAILSAYTILDGETLLCLCISYCNHTAYTASSCHNLHMNVRALEGTPLLYCLICCYQCCCCMNF
jgi:hypothetical protein